MRQLMAIFCDLDDFCKWLPESKQDMVYARRFLHI